MKVKLKGNPVRKSLNDCFDGKYLGIDLHTWKKINRGEIVDIIEIPEEAKEYLVSIQEKVKKPMAEELIFGALSKGGHVAITLDKGEISFKYSSNQDKKKELV